MQVSIVITLRLPFAFLNYGLTGSDLTPFGRTMNPDPWEPNMSHRSITLDYIFRATLRGLHREVMDAVSLITHLTSNNTVREARFTIDAIRVGASGGPDWPAALSIVWPAAVHPRAMHAYIDNGTFATIGGPVSDRYAEVCAAVSKHVVSIISKPFCAMIEYRAHGTSRIRGLSGFLDEYAWYQAGFADLWNNAPVFFSPTTGDGGESVGASLEQIHGSVSRSELDTFVPFCNY